MNFGQLIDQLRGTFGEHIMAFDGTLYLDTRSKTVIACGMLNDVPPEPFALLSDPFSAPSWEYIIASGSEDLSPQVMQAILTLPVPISPLDFKPFEGTPAREQRFAEILDALHPHKEELT